MKIPSIIIIWTEVEEESHLKNPGNIIYKIIQENFPYLKEDTPVKVQEAYRTSNRLEEEKESPGNVVIKTQIMQYKGMIFKSCKSKWPSNT